MAGTDKFETIDEMVKAWDARGALEPDRIRDAMIVLHEMARKGGIDPESPESYKAMILVLTILAQTPMFMMVSAIDLTALACCRAIRDIEARGH